MTELPVLPCPECRMRGHGGMARIGNRRNTCSTCNNYAQNVMRMTRKRLLAKHADEYQAIRLQIERDLYPQVLEDFLARHPRAAAATPEEMEAAARGEL